LLDKSISCNSFLFLNIIDEFSSEIYDFIEKIKNESKKYTDESLLLKWLQQGVSALDHLHNHQMIHRDIKPANLFLTIENDVKIGDFGLTLSTVGKNTSNNYHC
jgi:serine/threonine protein kinase